VSSAANVNVAITIFMRSSPHALSMDWAHWEELDMTAVRYMHPVCIGSMEISKDIGTMHLGLTTPMSRATSDI
jgi:hypothetical protein